MKNKLLTLIIMFLLVGPSIAFSMDDNGYSIEEVEEMEEYPEEEYSMEDEDEFPEESMFVEEEEDEGGEGDMED